MHAGELLGPYLLRREIGEGGIAAVFLAEHVAQRHDVVLKVLRREHMSQPQTVSIFLGEPRALQVVEHENTLEVLDVVGEGPHRYFATEMLRGRTLAEVLKSGPLPMPRAMHIARQIAAVLAHAHDVDVVHRNLKPANVFLVRKDGTPDFVKLLELGAVRMQNQGDKPVPGTVIGTPAYMAPEQLRQSPGDHRVDMYSFGILLYELAVGQRPFVGEVADIVKQHLLEKAPRASLLADVPDSLDKLIAQCLEKDANDRPTSMHEVSLVLGALAEGMGPPSQHDDTPAKWVAVPKNTSGYTTVVVDAVAAPPPVVAFEEDEPSFESVTGEQVAVLRAPRHSGELEVTDKRRAHAHDKTTERNPELSPVRSSEGDAAGLASSLVRATPAPIALGAVVAPTKPPAPATPSTSASTSTAAPPTSPAPASPASPAWVNDTIVPTPAAAPARPMWQIVAAAAAGAIATLLIVTVASGDGEKSEAGATDVNVTIKDPVNGTAVTDLDPVKDPAKGKGTPKDPPTETPSAQGPPKETPEQPPKETPKDAPKGTADVYPVAFGSTPPGAQVWIRMDKRIRLLCNTPCTFKLPKGKEVLVELKLDGYKSQQGTIVVDDGVRFDANFRRR